MLYKVVQAFHSVDKIVRCDHSSERQSILTCLWVVMSDGRFTVTMTIQMKATFTFFCFHEKGNSFTAGQPLKSFSVILIKLAFPVTLAFGRLNGHVFT